MGSGNTFPGSETPSSPSSPTAPAGATAGAAVYATVPEVAALLRCSKMQVARLIRSGRLPAIDLGIRGRSDFRVRVDGLDHHLKAITVTPAKRAKRAPKVVIVQALA